MASLIDSVIFSSAKKLQGRDDGFGGPGGKMVRSQYRGYTLTLRGCRCDARNRRLRPSEYAYTISS